MRRVAVFEGKRGKWLWQSRQACRGSVVVLIAAGLAGACADPEPGVSPDAGVAPDAEVVPDVPADTVGPPDLRPPADLPLDEAVIAKDGPEPIDGRRSCEIVVTEGPDLGVPMCPQAVPTEAAACQPLTGFGVCTYHLNGCDREEWRCLGGTWKRTAGRSCTACPRDPPANDASCAELGPTRPEFNCYWSTADGVTSGRCYGCHWSVNPSIRPPACPALLPAAGDPCPGPEGLNCNYASACHNRDLAVCWAGRWEVTVGLCN